MNIEKKALNQFPVQMSNGFDANSAKRVAYILGAVDYRTEEGNRLLAAIRSLISTAEDKFDFAKKLTQFIAIEHKYGLYDEVSYKGYVGKIVSVGTANEEGVPCYIVDCGEDANLIIPIKELDKED